MAIEPYDNCPCGSGKKFKWCCQKVAKYAEKAEQVLDKGQVAAALKALDEGLAVERENLWLRTMKAQILFSNHEHEAAGALVDSILTDHPGYRPVLQLRLQDELLHGDAVAAVSTLQQILDATPRTEIDEPLAWSVLVGRALGELGLVFVGLQHLRLAANHQSLRAEVERELARVEGDSAASPWLRDSYEYWPAPAGGAGAAQRWANAVELARLGRWQRAATIFETLASELPGAPGVWFNLALCQASTAQDEAAARSLEQYAQLDSDEERALHALLLAQCLDPRESAQSVDIVLLRYDIRDHTRLIQKLKEHPRLQVHVLDARPGELEEGVKNEFYLLDKDFVSDADAVTMDNLPAIVGIVRTRGKQLELEFGDPAADDPRPTVTLEAAGDTIDPNGERTVAGTIPLSVYQMRRMWGLPSNASPDDVYRIRRMVHEQNYRDVWPNTPFGWLGNRTPRQAAALPELKRTLRAALLLNESLAETEQFRIDLEPLRRQLGLEPEPMFEGDSVDIARLPLGRLRQVKPETLSTPRLRSLFDRAIRFALPLVIQRSAAALVSRPGDRSQFDAVPAFRSLVEFARVSGDRAAAVDWISRARRFEAEGGAPPQPTWDIAEWQVSFQFDGPEEWAPRLSELMQKVAQDKEASSELTLVLMRLGLIRLAPHPQDPNRAVMDARPLEMILARYGTRQARPIDLTPVGGQPGRIWTPTMEPGTSSSIVLPGQEPAKPRSKLVIP